MYTVKGYVPDGDKQRHVTVLATDAASCMEAITRAAEAEGMTEVTACALSPIKEVLGDPSGGDTYFIATVQTEEGEEQKPQTYQMLVVADDFDKANKSARETLEQGYGMSLVGLKKTKLWALI